MSTPSGLFELRDPRDLLNKARSDLARLRSNPMDTYAAFDFFITARHVPHWLHPNEPRLSENHFANHVELRVCRHLADGAKHFVVNDPRHHQVQATARQSGAWGDSWGNSWGNSWGTRSLLILLDPADQSTGNLGNSIVALDLAEKVLHVLEQIVT